MRVINDYLSWLLLVLSALIWTPAFAAQCADIFNARDGVNENLQDSGNTLDLSGVSFANNPWPVSGTTLPSGDYYFGGANLGNGYRLNVANGARVRIFVNGSLATGNNLSLNANQNSDQLLLVVNGNFATGNNAAIRGLVYASGAISLGNNAEIRGGLAAGGSIGLGNQGPVVDYSGVNSGLLAGLCEGAVELRANGQTEGPVVVGVGDTVTFAVSARSCPVADATLFSPGWVDTWSEDGSIFSQNGFADSVCDRTLTQTRTYTEPGSYAIEFESRYCSDGQFFFCGEYSLHGRDQIVVEVTDSNAGLTCFNDEYATSGLNPDDWVTSVSSGSFTPTEVNGRLRMTEARSNQSTAATLQREIPGADNLVILEFDYYAYGGDGADGIAVVLSDALITPRPGSFGGSLGYAQRDNGDAGFAGGWLGIGIDEYGNFSASTEGRQGGPGKTLDSVAIRGSGSGSSGYRYLQGTGTLNPGIDATGSSSPHRYRITVDSRNPGEALVSVERDTGSGFQALIAPFDVLNEPGQAAVPENFLLSLTGSTGGSTNIHELDNVELCALKLNPVGAQVDHFEIVHDGVALTCQPETVTIRACANADCEAPGGLFTEPVTATLAPANGWVGGNDVTFSGGVGQATLQNTTGGVVTLDVVGSQPATRPQSVTLCDNGSGTLSSGQCQLEFFESGLAFDVPDLISHRPSGPIEVRAVRRDEQSQACVPAFENVTRPVRFWSTYSDPGPNGRPVSRPVAVNGSDVSGDSANPSVLNLNFGPGGIAEIDVTYPDAGLMQLDARYSGSAATNDEGLVMPGADQFRSRPAGLCIRTGGECAAGDSSCPRFVRADEEFDLSITAVGWQSDTDADLCAGNPVTPNFRLLDIPLGASVIAPSGGVNGEFGPASYTHTRSASATETLRARVSEVGVFRFSATPPAGTYLGLTANGGTSQPTGRFYPDRFAVVVDPGEMAAVCTSGAPFAYTGQSFGYAAPPSLTIEPLSVAGSRTENYTAPGFRQLAESGVVRTFPSRDASVTDQVGNDIALNSVVSSGVLAVMAPGLLTYTYNPGDSFTYVKTPMGRIAPFAPDLPFAVESVTDSDGVSAEQPSYPFTPQAAFDVYYGRLVMENVYGPENIAALDMPFRLEYWDGSRFSLNTDDSCSSWTTADISNTANHHTLVADSGAFTAGTAGPLILQPDGTRGTDTLVWDVPDWLRDDVDDDGILDAPSGLATFGVYRGHDRVIYWQER